MVRAAFVGGLAVAVAIAGGAAANGQGGRVVRVEQPPAVDVRVPAGMFELGMSEQDIEDQLADCAAAYPNATIEVRVPPPPGMTPSGILVDQRTFCEAYGDQLAHLAARPVHLDAYAIDRDEVTTAAFRRCVAAGGCALDALVTGDTRYTRDDWPMVNVTWYDAGDYCRWRGARLPTEAEWEHAARGDDGRRWPWGGADSPNDFNHGAPRPPAMAKIDRAHNAMLPPVWELGDPDDSDGTLTLAPPGTYPWDEGPYGTRDQAGNVAEWTADAATEDGYDHLPRANPRRDGSTSDPRVVRGGSWRQPAFVAKTFARDPFEYVDLAGGVLSLYLPDHRLSHVGFRCARSL